ncbi:chorismate mutase [Rhizoctonia solani AG-3 Rhs1AP]|uniref:Chorismate mutase n=2 Tax=Rhizoctonia solani AG-3 TaxID=1086053 RepID=A0A074RZ81_9AGAM|nr:chorismate mutase [Rhizoctonia solani AG-3 Rhs1AP]KEP52289.1 chorismate mutase [Rhizoctonia solani 123E]
MASSQTFDAACYGSPLPTIPPANDTRSIPWGTPGVKLANGTNCCNSIEEVRTRIGAIDAQILKLLGQRQVILFYCAYVEAGRFKSNRTLVFNQAANDVVVQRALNSSQSNHIPETITVEVYNKILKTMLAFEYCSVSLRLEYNPRMERSLIQYVFVPLLVRLLSF